jgi:predicted AAA+ superfamily ATPase
MDYLPRVFDKTLKETLGGIGAVLIVGPKWCGKTTTAEMQAKSVIKMQDPDKSQGYLVTAETKPSLLLKGENPRLIDEWQVAPVLWDAVRTEVDKRGKDGLFILTGSTSVDDSKIMHSGTGRIARLMMHPMSLFESKESNGTVSLQKLFNKKSYKIDGAKSDLSVEHLIFAACRGGWPASLNKKTDKASLFVASSYLDNICESDASTVDGVSRDPKRMRAVLRSYARNVSTLAGNQTIIKDISANFGAISENTLYSYLNALNRLFVIGEVPSWSPAIRSASAIRASNKREFIDPSIAAAALKISPKILMQDLNTFGYIFETLCIRDLKVYSGAYGGEVSYYRDRHGLEADCVLRLNDGRYALIEFKLGSRQIEEGAEHLLTLQKLIKKYNAAESVKIKEPELLIVITVGEMAYRRKDGIYIIPIGCLRE